MPKEYTREQLRQLYIKLPEELKEVLSSEATAESIEDICKKNGMVDERVSEISDLIRNVLLGLLPPEEFQKTLEEESKLAPEVAKKVFQEIHRQIFYPVQIELSKLYPTETMPTAPAPTVAPGGEKPVEEKKEDVYREAID